VNQAKLTQGLSGLARDVNAQGVSFGLWVEPEAVNPKSELYEQHPEWCLHVPGRPRTEIRNELLLDLGREDVQEHLVTTLSAVFDSAPLAYVKWDFNRPFTEAGSAVLPPDRQGEVCHRYMLGLYRVLERLMAKYPQILFEGCASGGGRFDPGMLYYFPQTWTSDNTDAVSRLYIQWGTSLVYPASAMGAHVSAVPNHQVGRETSLEMRAHVAMMGGAFGYELDLGKLSDDDKEAARKHVAIYREVQRTIHFGDLYRLESPFTSNWPAWMYVSKDRAEAVVFAFQKIADVAVTRPRLRLRGLDEGARYEVRELERTFGADQLLHAGLELPFYGDHVSMLLRLRRA
jgi:alpha-galactosidase